MSVPELTDNDRREALKIAIESRRVRADVLHRLSSGELSAADVIEMRKDRVIGKMKVVTFIESVPGFGKVKTEKLMDKIGISKTRRLQGLGKRQVDELLKALN